jgi:hypothetical protein
MPQVRVRYADTQPYPVGDHRGGGKYREWLTGWTFVTQPELIKSLPLRVKNGLQ